MNVAVIGCGNIGRDHIARFGKSIATAAVSAVFDVDQERMLSIAREFSIPHTFNSGEELIASPQVDAVLVASLDESHFAYVMECIRQRKPVLCEKPLGVSAEDCQKIVEAEQAAGRHLVQVGFMRRFDPAYGQMKELLQSGTAGRALLIHAIHRNAFTPPYFTTDMSIKNSLVHEMDLFRWLLDDEYLSAQVLMPRSSALVGEELRDPQILLLETREGVRIDIESFVNCRYGYDVRCELVCEEASLSLAPSAPLLRRQSGVLSQAIDYDWTSRFREAYDIEISAWIHAIQSQKPVGSTAWDGYMACHVAEICDQARKSGEIKKIPFLKKPDFYA